MLTLAATVTDKSSRLFAETLPWILLLLGAIIAGGVIILIARRHIYGGEDSASGGFTLHDLRELHRAGDIDDEEFARAKAQMIGRLANDSARKPTASDESSTGNTPASEN